MLSVCWVGCKSSVRPSFHLPPSAPGVASGTGSVLKIQELLHICSESHKPEEESEEGGEAGGKKSGESDSKTAGKTKDGKDKSESELSSGEEVCVWLQAKLECG